RDGRTRSFSYRAIDRSGRDEQGVLSAVTRDEALRSLTARGLFPLSVAPGARSVNKRRVSHAELGLGFRLLADLLDAGLPMTRALQTLQDIAPSAWRLILP